MMLGMAAMRSIMEMSARRMRAGAYSEMNRAVATPTGTAMMSAITAITTPNGRIAAMPNWWVLMNHVGVVKKRMPTALNAVSACSTRKTRMLAVMASTASPAPRSRPRNTRSPKATGATMVRSWSSSTDAGVGAGVPVTAMMVRLPASTATVQLAATHPGRMDFIRQYDILFYSGEQAGNSQRL